MEDADAMDVDEDVNFKSMKTRASWVGGKRSSSWKSKAKAKPKAKTKSWNSKKTTGRSSALETINESEEDEGDNK